MYAKTHPLFLEEYEVALEQNHKLAQNAQLESLLLEFEHSDEFRKCAPGYLQTPRLLIQDFLQDTGLEIEHLDPEALAHGLFVVLPSRLLGLMPEDAHQILQEQLSFWAFAHSQWQLEYAPSCLQFLDAQTLTKLNKIINLGNSKQLKRVRLPAGPQADGLSEADSWELPGRCDQDVYFLNYHYHV